MDGVEGTNSGTRASSADTVDHDGDVEGEVVGVGIRGSGGTENASSANKGVEELNLAEEADGARGAGNGGANGLAHVAKNQVSSRAAVGSVDSLLNSKDQSGRGSGHVARGVVANNVGGIRDQLKGVGGGGSSNGSSAEEVVGVINLTNETADG